MNYFFLKPYWQPLIISSEICRNKKWKITNYYSRKIFIFTVYTRCQNIAQRPETSHFFLTTFFFFSSFFHKQNNSTITFKAPWMLCVIDVFFLRRISEYPKILSVKIHIKGGIVKNIQTDCSSFHLKFQRRVYNAGSIFGISELKSVFYIPFFF